MWPLPYNLLWVQCSNNTLIFREFCIDFMQSEFFPNVTPNNRKKTISYLNGNLSSIQDLKLLWTFCVTKKTRQLGEGQCVKLQWLQSWNRFYKSFSVGANFILSLGNFNSVRTWPNFIDFPTRVPRISWMCVIDNSIGLR